MAATHKDGSRRGEGRGSASPAVPVSSVAPASSAPSESPTYPAPSAPAPSPETQQLGLRERNKRDKRLRIIETASRLFAEKGYSHVTTSSIAREAHVGNGTLFRYARSKADLLVAVMNDLVLEGIRNGLETAETLGDPLTAILEILRPLSRESLAFPENMIEYQKEALFGDTTHQNMVTTRVADAETTILQILEITDTTPRKPSITREDLARAIYATVYMDIVQASVGRTDIEALPTQVPRTINNLIRAFCE